MTNGGLALTVLGCDGGYPGPGGACSSYLVTCGGHAVWMDAGPGGLAALQQHRPRAEVDAVVISHSHVDHWGDLEHFAKACRWYWQRSGVPVYGPAEMADEVAARAGAESGHPPVLAWHAVSPEDRVEIGPMTFSFSLTDHPVPTHAVRVEAGGRCLGYSADSGPGWSFAQFGADLDLAVCEATYLSDREGTLQHLSARQAGAMARRAGVRRLVLTHLAPGSDRRAAQAEAETAFGAEVEVAYAGATYVA